MAGDSPSIRPKICAVPLHVLANGAVIGRIFKANAAPVGTPWMWTLAFGHHEDRTPTHGYAETREAALAAWHEAEVIRCPLVAPIGRRRPTNAQSLMAGLG
jgi:hypothetical protein